MLDRAGGFPDRDYRLEDRYLRESGRVFLTGTQALVRIALDQARRDRAAGLNIAGFISGYRGSPLGGVDLELWRAKTLVAENRIEFMPAVNEDLAATAVLGSQQVETSPDKEVDGVFGLWYGKGPGLDRAGDALKHGNAYGSSPHGGVLVVAGDDHGCVSSSMPHQSDVAFMAWFMPTLNPASVAEYLTFGEYGYALSRFSGMWAGFKAISETVESAASVEIVPPRLFNSPDFTPPPGGLHYRWPDLPGPQIEERMEAKKHAVYAFAEANPIDRHIYRVGHAGFGIVTTGKAHLDLMEALRLLGLGEAECRRIGIDIYKIGMVWPLARRDALDFVREKREVLVVEEKRGIVESQFKEYFYDYPGHKPERMVGKRDEKGERLIPWTGELSPHVLAPIVAKRLDAVFPGLGLSERAAALQPSAGRIIRIAGATRTPYFCSGCPHNISTKVPEGSKALAGIGCHFMASWMDRETSSLIQMGGEGVNWVASSKFTGHGHIFQNLGEGTWYHSGSMAIRQAVAAKANITYKILYNDAVAMTGGQPVDGPVSVLSIAHAARAEGVERIALVSDQPEKFDIAKFPAGTTLDHRRNLDPVQRELREVPGVSVLIYEQACATEKRRRRKRGTLADPARFAVINELVCEGCGDCSTESNCLSVEPVETEFGRKRRINLSSCNKDFSCVNGFCPSFVTVEGARRRKKDGAAADLVERADALDEPEIKPLGKTYDLLVTGVGGTGVITVGQIVTMAAHLEGKGASVLDFTGFAQKFGPVLSYIRLAGTPGEINQVRIDEASADALIGCDLVVSSSPKASNTYRPGARAVINMAEMPTGDLVRFRDADLRVPDRIGAIRDVLGAENVSTVNANKLAETLFGDAVFANMLLLGFAWQKGLIPVSLAAIERAIELNGVAVERNLDAFAAGRLAAAGQKPGTGDDSNQMPEKETIDALIDRRAAFLRDYQNAAWAARYRSAVERVRQAEKAVGSEAVAQAVARSLFKLMAYKDEYEVARLHMETGFLDRLKEEFEGDYKVNYHLAPPLLPLGHDARGRPRKLRFGQWMQVPFRMLARLKFLRGTALDPFGHTAERREERALIGWYEDVTDRLAASFGKADTASLAAIAALPMEIRGYGPVKQQATARVRTEMAARLAALQKDGKARIAEPAWRSRTNFGIKSMFETLKPAEPDKILALIGAFQEDTREGKVDLGVGVYRDHSGNTPIMRAVREAEKRLHDQQTTKTYLGPGGDRAFMKAIMRLVLGAEADLSRVRGVQAPGGSGALRVIAELLQRARPGATVWLSDPTWPNHSPLIGAAGLGIRSYPYFDAATGTVRFDAMLEALQQVPSGDIVLLHGCCHNPTGANLSREQWAEVADVLVKRGLFPFVDLAYQGFGDGLDEDAYGVRLLASRVPEMAIAASCSKNFSVYRDRVGAALVTGRTEAEADVALGQLMGVARGMYSMPPDHAAAVVRIVLEDEALRRDWMEELESMRRRMVSLRQGFADALRRQSNSDRFDFLARHRGMFSRLGITPGEVGRLREEHGVYMIGDSRINVAGLPQDGLDKLAAAIVSVVG